jgi:hypothetical protein
MIFRYRIKRGLSLAGSEHASLAKALLRGQLIRGHDREKLPARPDAEPIIFYASDLD